MSWEVVVRMVLCLHKFSFHRNPVLVITDTMSENGICETTNGGANIREGRYGLLKNKMYSLFRRR